MQASLKHLLGLFAGRGKTVNCMVVFSFRLSYLRFRLLEISEGKVKQTG